MKIYLHDLIGIHSGVNYYLDTFVLKMAKHNIDVVIKSNYNTNDNNTYYPNIFKGCKLKRTFLLLISYSKFFYAICKLKKQQIIIVSLYGTYVDLGLRTNTGNTYRLKLVLKDFPYSKPDVYVIYPKKLQCFEGKPLSQYNASSSMHLLTPDH